MSDRIYLTRTDGESMQLFGNYEFPEKLYKYLKRMDAKLMMSFVSVHLKLIISMIF